MIGLDNATPLERSRWAYSIVDLAHAEGAAQQKAEIQRCARKTNGDGYIPSGYASGAYIVPGFVLDPEPEVTP